MKIEKTNIFQISGLILSIFGVGTIISNADIQKIIIVGGIAANIKTAFIT